ncbi:MAG: sugar ABC transporter permease [Chloroflexota bacterium]|nr:MAG: spermidine/putrescine ABC transporter permease [Chloroflexota bacterium]
MAVAVAKTPRLSRTRRRELFYGILFASPWLIGFVLWMIIPVLSSAYYSLTRYDLLRPPVFIGLTNYVNLASDNDFYLVLWNTLWWVVLSAPLGVASAFLMAVLLNTKIIARSTFRAIFFFPSIVPVIVVASVWNFLLNIQFGAINSTLRALELPAIPFLSNPAYTKPTLLMIHMWAQGSAMVIFLATLQDVPRELYEAATIDGAGSWSRFWNITLPMCSPVILFNLVMAFIAGFQNFNLPWLLTQGGPNRSMEFFAIYLYRNAFIHLRMGKASALAWILFIVIILFTVALFRSSARWVYYRSE